MDRRRFCKIGALALGALGVGRLDGLAAGHMTSADGGDVVLERSCRVIVLRRECYDDIQTLYLDDPETGPCDVFATGEEWNLRKGMGRPAGFCERAWRSIAEAVNAQCACTDMVKDVLVVACPDGTRPVVFRVEII